ncbi:hypothetical protein [Butyrivibrio sp. NC2007]|uniref:hypothetical protein n=1 Tax=Butyrivibrio sp. NC2007 TaxID=1280683 RepID=UPI0003B349CD|nr:hypothetical protein [Butyrivibrio sp. NC2007]
MDKVEMRIERGNAELLVRYELSNIHYDTKVYKKAFEFIFITIILGALWVWCSSSPESNVFVFLSEHQMVRNVLMFCSPIILYGIWGWSIVRSSQNIRKSIDLESKMDPLNLRKVLEKYIIGKLEIDPDQDLDTKMKYVDDLLENDKCIVIDESTLSSYLSKECFPQYVKEVSVRFWYNLAKMILLSAVLESWLLVEGEHDYKFSTKDNARLRIMVVNQELKEIF